jgi:hypothetical protein
MHREPGRCAHIYSESLRQKFTFFIHKILFSFDRFNGNKNLKKLINKYLECHKKN